MPIHGFGYVLALRFASASSGHNISRGKERGNDPDLHARDAEAGDGGEESAGWVRVLNC
jgi:hypothetical protein